MLPDFLTILTNMLFPIFLFVLMNVIMALVHNDMIDDGRKIEHGWWGFGYVVFCCGICGLYGSWLLLLDSVLIRKVVFDLSLNLFRGKPLFYVSSSPASIIDKIHNKIFGLNSIPYMVVYFAAMVVISVVLC